MLHAGAAEAPPSQPFPGKVESTARLAEQRCWQFSNLNNLRQVRPGRMTLAAGMWLAAVFFVPAIHSTPLPLPTHARYVFQKVGEDLGLGTITPVCIFQDRQGFVWIGSMNGLLRYDGAHVLKFGADKGVPENAGQITEGQDGRVWVASRRGLAVQNAAGFSAVALPDGVNVLATYQPVVMRNGRIYLATDHGLWIFDEKNAISSTRPYRGHIFPSQQVEAVYADADGKVWFAVGGRVGWLNQALRPHLLPAQKGIPKDPIVALLQDGKRRLWLRTTRHLLRLDSGAEQFVPDAPELPPANDVGSPSIDRKGRLMVPTVRGLFLRHEDYWEVIDEKRGTATNSVFSAMQDREGTYWLGLGGNGIERWEGEGTWSGWTDAEGLPDKVVWAELRDARQRLWLATNQGVAMWDAEHGRFRVWKERDGLNGSIARQLALASDGSVWVLCHPGGLTRFDPDSLRPQRVRDPAANLTSLARGPDGRIWVAARSSVKALRALAPPFIFDDVAETRGDANSVTDFSLSPDGVLWTSGSQGVARYDGKTVTHYTRKDGLLFDAVYQVVAVDRNEAWVRYADVPGITRLRVTGQGPQVEHIARAEGVISDEVFMLGKERDGTIWAGGSRGLARIARDGTVRRYRHDDGLLWDDQSEGGFFAEPDGTILFGTSGGLARFDPHAEGDLSLPSFSVVLTSAQLGGRERLAENRPEAGYKENALHAEFAALSYRSPAAMRCWYRLDGLDSEWTETLSREIRYAALAPGSYALEISCESGAGVKSTPAFFYFEVTPAWWLRWWARAFGTVLFGLILYGLLRFRTYSLEKDRRRLERAVAERSAELERVNQELRDASLTDPLTGARNRRFFQETIEADINQAVRAYTMEKGSAHVRNHDLIFYVIDADFFKEVNDLYGHAAGDEMLAEMTRRIQSAVRMSDVLVRWGGEEFLVVSRFTERSEATTLAARILNVVGSRPFALKAAGEPIRRTCSIGWAAFPWFSHAPGSVGYEVVVELADRALYAAKQAGRNRAVGMLSIDTDLGNPNLAPDQLRATQIVTLGPGAEAKSVSSGA